jgi:KaiC/GvpD/RAD55 family RecA-like ATPase
MRLLGIDTVDSLIDGEIRAPMNMIILGDPGVGKTALCQQFISVGLKNNDYCIYIAMDNHPDEIRGSLSMPRNEVRTNLMIVDCYSAPFKEPCEPYYILDRMDINAYKILLSKVLALPIREQIRIAFDSISSLLILFDTETVLKFLQETFHKLHFRNCLSIFTLNRTGCDPRLCSILSDMAGTVIELKFVEDDDLKRFLRINKVKNASHSTRWVQYDIKPMLGFVRV